MSCPQNSASDEMVDAAALAYREMRLREFTAGLRRAHNERAQSIARVNADIAAGRILVRGP